MRWRRFLGLVLFVLAALTVADAPAQQQETRIALVIANEAYVSANLGRLPGTQRDATTMRAALQRAGFQVTLRTDLTRAQMRSELSAFANRLAQLGQRGVGFLYYAGHGVADGPRGQNYLVPVDAQIAGVPDLPATSIALNAELDGIALAGARATILVIDACRNTPVALRRGGRGLAPVSAVTDTLVAFSTDAGETATDDGIYARVLADELQRPGADAATVFAQVQRRVAEATGRAQRPRYDNGLLGDPIVFVATSAPTSIATAPATTPPRATAPPPAAVASNSTNPDTGRDQTLLIDDAALQNIALSAWSQERQRTPLWNNRAAQQRLERVGRRIVSVAGRGEQAWEFALLDTPNRYAFVLPGNKVGFSRGLMEMMSLDDYIAAVLGHEVGHLIGRHAAERYSLELSVSLGARPPVNRQVAMAALGMGTQGGIVVPFSREQELEADILGLNYMHSAGYDVRQVIALWTEIGGVYGLPEMRSAQPDLGTRILRIRTYINQQGWGPA